MTISFIGHHSHAQIKIQWQENFEGTKGIMRSRKSKKDRQHKDQMKDRQHKDQMKDRQHKDQM